MDTKKKRILRKRPKQPSAANEAILETFLKLSAQMGVHQITLQMVAKKMRISYGTIHYHFGPPNRHIVDVALDYVAEKAQLFVKETLASALLNAKQNAVSAYLRANLAWANAKPNHASFWLHCLYLGTTSSHYKKILEGRLLQGQQRIQGFIRLEQSKGHYGDVKDLPRAAREIQMLIFGALLVGTLGGERTSHIENHQHIFSVAQRLLSPYSTEI